MLRKLFWEDAYCAANTTTIRAVDGNTVFLAESVFFAFTGGQESDAGTIAGCEVLNADKQGFDIAYTLATGHGLQVGQVVRVEIDWARRYQLMRLHFAAEMVLQLVYQLQPGIVRIGAHISTDKARIDFARDSNIAELFPAIEAKIADLLAQDTAIITAFSDEAQQRRYWDVAGFARMACGGTHPHRVGEVGALLLKRKNQGKGKERIEITLLASN
jgi:alanyl-tRNA synthetase